MLSLEVPGYLSSVDSGIPPPGCPSPTHPVSTLIPVGESLVTIGGLCSLLTVERVQYHIREGHLQASLLPGPTLTQDPNQGSQG